MELQVRQEKHRLILHIFNLSPQLTRGMGLADFTIEGSAWAFVGCADAEADTFLEDLIMQGGSTQNENVVSIFSRSKKEEDNADTNTEGLSFEEIMRRNIENKERMKKERAKANQSVIRSYRLKPR